jgi:hypothetical protein
MSETTTEKRERAAFDQINDLSLKILSTYSDLPEQVRTWVDEIAALSRYKIPLASLETATAFVQTGNTMIAITKREKFVCLIQTAAIVESLSHKTWPGAPPSRSELASIAVSAAIEVPESDIPSDMEAACGQLIDYVYNNSMPKPAWLIGIL